MKIKNVKREYLIILAIAGITLIAAFSLIFKAELNRFWYESLFSNKCKDISLSKPGLKEGSIFVHFWGNISEAIVKENLNSYGLYFFDSYGTMSRNGKEKVLGVIVGVPRGKEDLWVCILSEAEKGKIEIAGRRDVMGML